MSKKDKPFEESKAEELSESPAVESAEPKDPKDYEVESAMHDLIRAHKHKKNPKLMKAIHAKMTDHKEAIGSIEELKAVRQKKLTEPQAS